MKMLEPPKSVSLKGEVKICFTKHPLRNQGAYSIKFLIQGGRRSLVVLKLDCSAVGLYFESQQEQVFIPIFIPSQMRKACWYNMIRRGGCAKYDAKF